MSYKTYVLKKLLLTIPTIFIFTTVVFFILHIIPGDPVSAIVGPNAPESVKEAMRSRLGLDRPMYEQYFSYMAGLVTGQLGTSILTSRPIVSELQSFFPATVELMLGAVCVTLLLGISLGLVSSITGNSKLDMSIRLYGASIYAVPVFWLGLMLQLVFGVYLRVLPIAGMGNPPDRLYTGIFILDSLLNLNLETFIVNLKSLILPSISIGLILSGVLSRLTRAYVTESFSQDYTTAAKARGLREQIIIFRYGLKNALIPLVTIVGLQVAVLLGGAILTESTFSWPGVGLYLVQRIPLRDYPAVQGAVVLFAIVVSLVNLVVDVIYGWLDPRVRL